jgi:hypothetical protein
MASIFPAQFGAAASLLVGALDGDAWQSETLLASGAGMYGLNTAIDIDSSDRSHVAYTLADDWTGPGAVRYATPRESGGWQIRTIESGNNVGRFPSLAVDDDDQVHVAWINASVTDPNVADVRYGQLVDGQWEIETVAQLDSVRLGFSGARKLVSLEVDSTGTPHLAYGDRNSVSYATRDSVIDDWAETSVVQTEDGILNGLVVLSLDSNEEPGIAFWRPQAGAGQGVVSLALFSDTELLLGDFNGDGQLTATDIDLLTAALGTVDTSFDMNTDGVIDASDREVWLRDLAFILPGDANFDGQVNFADFLLFSANFQAEGGWANGDFDGVGGVAFADFLQLSANFGRTVAIATVPEPAMSLGLVAAVIGHVSLRRKRRYSPALPLN